jgi:hypothetical protein
MKEQKFSWIVKIIESCTDTFHFECVDRLIDLFYEQEKDESLADDLRLLKFQKFNEIHLILR